jgi:ligand-binding sensor domain-containing protein
MSLYRNILFIFLTLTVTCSYAQPIALNFLHYNTSHQLGSNNVRKTIQDSRGYIWCATQDGLYRFDGNTFTAYNKSLSKKHALSGADIRDLVIAQDTLWAISSYGGIDAIDIITGNVVYSFNQQTHEAVKSALFLSMAISGNQLFIGSDKGLYQFNTHTRQLHLLPVTTPDAMYNTININKLLPDGDNLWLFCNKGAVCVINKNSYKLIAFHNSRIPRFYDAETHKGIVTAGTSDGIRQYRQSNGRILEIRSPFLAHYQQVSPVFAVKKDQAGNIWFSDKNNLLKLDTAFKNIQPVYSGKLINGKDLTSSVYGIFFDNSNNCWLSSQEGLLFSTNTPTAFLTYNKSRSTATAITHSYYLYPDNDTTVFVCAEDGLYKVNPNRFSITPIDQGKTYFYAFRDHHNNLVVSNDEGTFILQNDHPVPFEVIYPEFNQWGIIMLNSYVQLNDSLFALGSQNRKGIYIWNIKTRRILNIHTGSAGIRLADDNINTLYKESSEKLWILCDNSISRYNVRTGSLTDLTIENPRTKTKYTIFFDICRIRDTYYIASYSNGIIMLDKNYRFIKEISTQNNLANNGVYKLLPYKDSLLIATTNNGLSVLTLPAGPIKNYYEKDGLQSNEFEELSGNVRNNLVFAGGKDGFTIIDPGLFTKNETPPVVFFRSISIENDPGNRIDTTNLNIQQVSIPNTAKQTIIYFSGINYPNPDKTIFSYKITELQQDWIALGKQQFITLIGLSPGTYHLQVQSFNEDGLPSAIKELTLVFLPKWNQTRWFKLLMLACVIGLVWFIYWYRINQIKKRELIKIKLARDLHDDLGSTLNGAKIYADLALMERQSEHLMQVKTSILEALTGIKDMVWILDDKNGTIEHLLTRFNAFAEPLCKARNITYHEEISDDCRSYKLGQEERRSLFFILKESVNNAIKYAECSKITLTVALRQAKLEIGITDNGNGFDTSKEPEGNGIKNMNWRAGKIKYHCKIVSSQKAGTSIQLCKM